MASKTKTQTQVPAVPTDSPFAIKRTLTLPAFKLDVNVPRYFYILDAMRVSDAKRAKGGKDGKPDMEPATVVHAVDMVTGEKGTFIVPAVVKGVWEDEYKDGAYVGKGFQVVKGQKPEGRRYHAFQVAEVEVPEKLKA